MFLSADCGRTGVLTMKIRLIVPNCNRGVSPLVAYGPGIARIAGGFTASQATGGWIDDNRQLIVEPVTVFDCNVDVDVTGLPRGNWIDVQAQFTVLAKRIAVELNQTCVFLEVDDIVRYVTK